MRYAILLAVLVGCGGEDDYLRLSSAQACFDVVSRMNLRLGACAGIDYDQREAWKAERLAACERLTGGNCLLYAVQQCTDAISYLACAEVEAAWPNTIWPAGCTDEAALDC